VLAGKPVAFLAEIGEFMTVKIHKKIIDSTP
jgi:hypothetical protein